MNLKVIVRSCAKRVYLQYPEYCEMDDLVSQGYLIALEKIDSYDQKRGASLRTFLSRAIEFGLSDYVRRTLIKEETLGGYRVDVEADTDLMDVAHQVEAKEALSSLLHGLKGDTRICIWMLSQGYSLPEIGEKIGVSKQRVYQIIKQVRDDNELC